MSVKYLEIEVIRVNFDCYKNFLLINFFVDYLEFFIFIDLDNSI